MDHKAVIRIVLRRRFCILRIPTFKIRTKKTVQHKSVDIGLEIENIDDHPCNEVIISQISWRPADTSISLVESTDKIYKFWKLNPGNKKVLWIDSFIPQNDGVYVFYCKVDGENEENIIMPYMRDVNKVKWPKNPEQLDLMFYVKNEFSLNQKRTNGLIMILTAIILINQTIGVDNIYNGIISWLKSLFLAVGSAL